MKVMSRNTQFNSNYLIWGRFGWAHKLFYSWALFNIHEVKISQIWRWSDPLMTAAGWSMPCSRVMWAFACRAISFLLSPPPNSIKLVWGFKPVALWSQNPLMYSCSSVSELKPESWPKKKNKRAGTMFAEKLKESVTYLLLLLVGLLC